MPVIVFVILVVAAFVTSTISGIIGMAGGILLLAIMFSVMGESDQIIPLHGAVQLISNGTRTVAYLRHVNGRVVARFFVGTLPGITLSTVILLTIGKSPEAKPYIRTLIGAYILIAMLLPESKGEKRGMTWYDFPAIGVLAGAASLIVGATGPIIAPLFARRNFEKEQLVATKAMCQAITHVEKMIVFAALGMIEFTPFTMQLAAMGAAAVVGTYTGRHLIRYLSAEMFMKIYKVVLALIGLKILFADGIWDIVKQSSGG